jgi:hypothetical protein|tara:strand:- start:3744 stop:3920 length:177 start_codon:yes stop_codon:yes gene_type:complete
MRIEQYLDLLIDGYTPADIVRELDLTEYDVMEMKDKINIWLGELQQEANTLDSYKRFK